MSVTADNSGHLYVFGGLATTGAGGILDTAYRYSVLTESWESITSLPVAVEDSSAVFAGAGNGYVLGGKTSTGATTTAEVYDSVSDSWSINTDLPAALYSHSAVIDSTGHIVIIGGYDSAETAVSSVYQSQRLDIPDASPMFSTDPVTIASLDFPYSYDVGATGNPEPTYSLVTAPEGMIISVENGLISWQPVAGQHGQQSVTVRAATKPVRLISP